MASECDDLKKAEHWRREILGEISKKISQIQNPGLGEFRIRDLNDEINKLLRVKFHWENRIIELGGPNYKRVGPRMINAEGVQVPGGDGYKYFGAAKDLPGVRELFENEPPAPPRKTRAELMKKVDADYYGYRDDDDGVLMRLEKEAEMEMVKKAVEDFKSGIATQSTGDLEASMLDTEPSGEIGDSEDPDLDISLDDQIPLDEPLQNFVAYVPDIPSQQEVENKLLQAKKMELLKQYASDQMIQQAEESRRILGYSS